MFTVRSGNSVQFDATFTLKGNSSMRYMYKNIIIINIIIYNDSVGIVRYLNEKTTTQYFSITNVCQLFLDVLFKNHTPTNAIC